MTFTTRTHARRRSGNRALGSEHLEERFMEKLWINPVVVAAIGLLGLATSPLRTLTTNIAADRDRRTTETARLAQERAFAAWAFDEDHQMWIPGVLKR
jgi:hypothetical protein